MLISQKNLHPHMDEKVKFTINYIARVIDIQKYAEGSFTETISYRIHQ
jgi:hypothetical protein